MKFCYLFFLFSLGACSLLAQDRSTSLPRMAVLSIDSRGLRPDAQTLGSMVRLELQKMGGYEVIDRYDMLDRLRDSIIDLSDCYSKRCLLAAARRLAADQIVSGSVERLGEKLLVNLKLIDASQGTVLQTAIGEYVMLPEELESMLRMTLYELLGHTRQNKAWEEALSYYAVLSEPVITRLINDGPRMGVAFLQGNMAERLQAPRAEGGYGASPTLLQVGYQHEFQYMGTSRFQGLLEVLGLLSGLEQSMFIPSVVLLNGFRDETYGLEIGFGPSIALRRMAEGYYDAEGQWQLLSDWKQTDSVGQLLPPPPTVNRLDRRGAFQLFSRWVWTVGITLRAGALNIPINLYYTGAREDRMVGLSMGFNLQQRR